MNTSNIPDKVHASATVGEAVMGDDGVLCHCVLSPFQSGETKIHVLLPSSPESQAPYKTIYLLPVARGDSRPWGDAMVEILKHEFHKTHPFVFVMPTFSHAPWYADHPGAPRIRQESHFLKVVVPFIESTYPVLPTQSGRLLLGFSKSGWGAYSLLLRNPQAFSKAVAWDAPLGQQSPNKYGMREVFAAQDALDPYCIWDLLPKCAEFLSAKQRLGLLGHGVFRAHHQATHFRMMKLGILHEYQDGPRREHDWHSGWVPSAVEFLARDADD
jgi:hypothetical protein